MNNIDAYHLNYLSDTFHRFNSISGNFKCLQTSLGVMPLLISNAVDFVYSNSVYKREEKPTPELFVASNFLSLFSH